MTGRAGIERMRGRGVDDFPLTLANPASALVAKCGRNRDFGLAEGAAREQPEAARTAKTGVGAVGSLAGGAGRSFHSSL